MESRRAPLSLLFCLLGLLAVFPALFGVQIMVRGLGGADSYLVAELTVRLNEKNATNLVLALNPDESQSAFAGGVLLSGAGLHKATSFPWHEEPFQAQLAMDFSGGVFGGASLPRTISTDEGSMVAWYRERYLGAKGGLSMRVPCHGDLAILKVRPSMQSGNWDWGRLRDFDATLQLRCTSFGRDLTWGTADDLEWVLEGPVELRWQAPH